jgi:hypothetical protein
MTIDMQQFCATCKGYSKMIRIIWKIIAAICICATYTALQTLDEQDKAEARESAHRTAVRLHDAGLIGQSNALVYPCCQVPVK